MNNKDETIRQLRSEIRELHKRILQHQMAEKARTQKLQKALQELKKSEQNKYSKLSLFI